MTKLRFAAYLKMREWDRRSREAGEARLLPLGRAGTLRGVRITITTPFETYRRSVRGVSDELTSVRARSKTSKNMLRVSLPVLVFCSDGW
jgi:hypothetical protein